LFISETYAYCNGLRHVHPGEKGLFFILTLFIALVNKSLVISLVLAGFIMAVLVVKARIPLLTILGFMLIPAGFVFLSLVMLVLSITREASGGLVLGAWAGYYLVISYSGIWLAKTVLAKVIGSLTSMIFLLFTTPLVDLMALLHRLKVPGIFLELMVLTYRFIFVFLETAGQIYRAQEARCGFTTRSSAFRALRLLIVNLFTKTLHRSHQLTLGLAGRGYRGVLLVPKELPPLSVSHLLGIVVFVLVLGIIVLGAAGGVL
jgi:cobalt/nickel transport system permease protein